MVKQIFRKVLLLITIFTINSSFAKSKDTKSKTPIDNSYPSDEDLLRQEERFTEEQRETFKLFKEDYKMIVQTELKNRIRENPQKKEELIRQYHEFYNTTLIDLMRNYRRGKIEIMEAWPNPGIGGSAPSGFGGRWGSIFAFGVYSPSKRLSSINDSAVGSGFGIGDPNKYIGGAITIVADSIYKNRAGRSLQLGRVPDFDLGGVHLKLARTLPFINNSSLGIGLSHIYKWGYKPADDQFLGSRSLSFSKKIILRPPTLAFSEIQYTLGAGNKNYNGFNETRYQNKGGYTPFAGIGVRLIPQVGVSIDYVSKEYHFTSNYAPFKKLPFVISLTATNIFWRNHTKSTYTLAGSTSYNFLE